MTYTVETDPYLSAQTKATIAKSVAEGADMSLVVNFLRDTAPLVKPTRKPSFAAPLILAAISIALALFGLVTLLS
jgi:hypothetical protein